MTASTKVAIEKQRLIHVCMTVKIFFFFTIETFNAEVNKDRYGKDTELLVSSFQEQAALISLDNLTDSML